MSNRIAWTGGNLNSGYGWTTFFNSSDLTSLAATPSAVLSSISAINNQTGQDLFMDVSFSLQCASSSVTAGMNFALFLAYLNQDGTSYGDGQYTTGGVQLTKVPAVGYVNLLNLAVNASATLLTGTIVGIPIYPGVFLPILQNNAVALNTSTQTVKFRTYNYQNNN